MNKNRPEEKHYAFEDILADVADLRTARAPSSSSNRSPVQNVPTLQDEISQTLARLAQQAEIEKGRSVATGLATMRKDLFQKMATVSGVPVDLLQKHFIEFLLRPENDLSEGLQNVSKGYVPEPAKLKVLSDIARDNPFLEGLHKNLLDDI